MSSENERDPTNEELRVALGKIAYNSTQRSRANTCYAAQERIYELTDALKKVRHWLLTVPPPGTEGATWLLREVSEPLAKTGECE